MDKHCRRNFQIASNNKVSVTTLQCICANGKTLIQNILLASLTIFIWDLQRMARLKHRSFVHGWQIILLSIFHRCVPWSCCLMDILHIYIFMLLSFVQLMEYFYFVYHCIHRMHCSQVEDFLEVLNPTFQRNWLKFTVQYPGVSVTNRTFSWTFTKAYQQSCCADVIKGSFRVSGVWLIYHLSVNHNLFNPGKTYTETANIDTPTDQSNPNFSRNYSNKEHESFDNNFEIVSEHNHFSTSHSSTSLDSCELWGHAHW